MGYCEHGNKPFHKKWGGGGFLTSWVLASQEGLCSMALVIRDMRYIFSSGLNMSRNNFFQNTNNYYRTEGYGLNDRGSMVRFPRGLGIFLFITASRTALGPTQPPIQWVPGTLSLEVKRPAREADHSPTSSADVKNSWSYTSTPPIRLHGVVLS
jgi:hypothetical protein